MTEEVIIDLKLEQDEAAFAKLANLKNSISSIKDQQKQLNEDFKQGKVPIQQYNAESVKLETNLKKTQAAYSGVQRGITGLKNPFDKLNESIKEQAKQVNVAGVSLSTFANPVTATVGVLGALFKAYTSSTIGAKDLENASNQLGAALNYATNQLSALVSGGGEGGEGFLSKAAFAFNSAIFGIKNASSAAQFAGLRERLDDLARESVKVQAANQERIKENAEISEKMADSQVSFVEKTKLAAQAVTNLRINEDELLKVKNDELKNLELLLSLDKENEPLQDAIGLKKLEIANIVKDTERAVSRIDKLESNLLDTENKKLEAIKKTNEEQEKKASSAEMERQIKQDQKEEEAETQRILELQQLRQDNQTASFNAWWDEQVRIATEANAEMDAIAVANFEKDKARNIKKVEGIKTLTTDITTILTQGLQGNVATGEQILKGYLIMAARALKTFLITKAVGESLTTWDSILTFGISGAIRGAVIAGLIEAAFAGVESVISGFATGGVVSGTKIKDGKRIQRSNGDNVLITAKKGEVILNERQQRALGGDSTFAKLGVPGFAMGGLVTSPVSSFGADSDMIKRMLREVSRRQVAVVIEDVERLQQTRAQIVEQATL